jgi:hypothetical protein
MVAAAFGLLLATGTATSASAANLIKTGSFEKPVIGTGTYQLYSTGSTSITNWTVVGSPGDVAIGHEESCCGGFGFPAARRHQYVDLTGLSRTATGVAQTVRTAPGAHCTLKFSVGNVYDPGGILGTTSTVKVLINGSPAMTATNTGGMGVRHQVWKAFTLHLTAASASTTVSFINGDPVSDDISGLDAVKLVAG